MKTLLIGAILALCCGLSNAATATKQDNQALIAEQVQMKRFLASAGVWTALHDGRSRYYACGQVLYQTATVLH
ncbi:hypothetical protein [Pseudoalteromonas viridis]|uniref:Uncharacterized protein n=1 Tax=Pseudoalteromonas viridis TaxID=339617 RepID=A0ABX7V5H6_9GAMM|nr:hypothetical protein [Pseudoalteromonas viridis]QTL36133.1 hypothetical protein J5X90_03530 [Pseudoalteromonas viridis]